MYCQSQDTQRFMHNYKYYLGQDTKLFRHIYFYYKQQNTKPTWNLYIINNKILWPGYYLYVMLFLLKYFMDLI